MSTLRHYVSRVRATDKLLSTDNLITDRVIAFELMGKATLFMLQKVNKRKLWDTSTIFTSIPCLELQPVPLSECCEYRSNVNVARSVFKIPRISDGLHGLLIQGVYNLEGTKKLKEVTLSRYINILELKLPVKDAYFWLHDGYLYVSSEFVKTVNLVAHFDEEVPDHIMYPDCDVCAGNSPKNPCLHPLDKEFKFPSDVADVAVTEVSKTLMNTYFRIPDDHTSDNKNSQTNNA